MANMLPLTAPDTDTLFGELHTLQEDFSAFQATIQRRCDCNAQPYPPRPPPANAQCACNPCNCPTTDHPCNRGSAPTGRDLSDAGLRRMLNRLTREVRNFQAGQGATCGCAGRDGAHSAGNTSPAPASS
ncbi:hypothetical protein J7T55_000007 [Diaporthe amygdali]|uniref:uncharacterized protein n=1 Tax=Phomopsis amygdali TaxID=1214568 RepID=UPI0022FE4A07|nr:uncharacterized protein J7T55_000007 [Diaporthe amygdali]KAJ0107745.1 hypothetical protein J7T55_000007 [Diaporthe amygdali]